MSTTFKSNVQDAVVNNELKVDTDTLFVDAANNSVGLGTLTPTAGHRLDVRGKSVFSDVLGLAKIATASLPAAASYQGYIVYDSTLNKFVYSNGSSWVDPSAGGGAMSIGGTVTSGTVGSLLFVGTGPALAQDNANLFWDDTNNCLGIGTSSPAGTVTMAHINAGSKALGLAIDVADGNIAWQAAGPSGTSIVGMKMFSSGKGRFYTDSAGKWITMGVNNADTLVIKNGNVGVDVADPTGYKFEVSGTAKVSGNLTVGTSAGFVFSPSGQEIGTLFGSGGNFTLYAEAPGSATGQNLFFGGSTRGDLYKNTTAFRVGSTEYMRIDGDFTGHTLGNVGIGTNTPAAKLHVVGTGTATLIVDNAANAVPIFIARDNGTAVFGIGDGGSVLLSGSAGTSGQVLTSAGAGAVPTWTTVSGGSMSIGGTVTSGTTGSLLFVGSGPVLAQDNANLFWDDTNNRLGIGSATPSQGQLWVAKANAGGLGGDVWIVNSGTNTVGSYARLAFGPDATTDATPNCALENIVTNTGSFTSDLAFKFFDGVGYNEKFRISSTGAVSYGASGNYGTAGQYLQSNGSGSAPTWVAAAGAMAIGGTVTGGTASYIPFIASGPVLAQNSRFAWDNTASASALVIGGDGNTGTARLLFDNQRTSTGISSRIAFNSGGASGPAPNPRAAIDCYFDGGDGKASLHFLTGRNTNPAADTLVLTEAGVVQVPTTTGNTFVVDTNTFVVDATNNRVGVGTASPSFSLDVAISVPADAPARIANTSSTGYSIVRFDDNSLVNKGSTGYGNTGVAAPLNGHCFQYVASGPKFLWYFASRSAVVGEIDVDGSLTWFGDNTANPADGRIVARSSQPTFTRNTTGAVTYSVDKIKPIFNFGGSNATTTVNLLEIDSTNTSTTGLTANLIKASYGGTQKFLVDSGGAVTIAGTASIGGVATFSAANVYNGATGITAFAGGGQGSATALTAEVNFVTTVATTADSVKLPTAALGARIVVFNNGANSVDIFPASGAAIDALGTNNAYSLAAGSSREFWGQSSTQWYSR